MLKDISPREPQQSVFMLKICAVNAILSVWRFTVYLSTIVIAMIIIRYS